MPIPPAIDLPTIEHAEIVVDGIADESVWDQAVSVGDFVTYRPKPGMPSKQETVVKVFSTKKGLYLHFRASDKEPDRIKSGYGRRDSRRNDDYIGLALDLLGTGERGNLFIVNPLGVQLDGTLVRGRDRNLVPWRGGWSSWDARWESAGRIHESGYDVEIGIPWSAVRHPETVDRMRLMVFRRISRTAEMSSWPSLDPDVQGTLVQMAQSTGPGQLKPDGAWNIQPEVTATQTDSGPPSDRVGIGGVAPGGTVRFAPTPSLQILATANPDFSTVESDESKIDVNSRYSLRYEEKRPFFLEGQEWFTHPIKNLIYTRSMVAPIGGARATAEAGNWTVAALSVWDQSPAGSVTEGESWSDDDVANRDALSTVGRIRYAFGRDNMIGAIVSDKQIVGTRLHNQLWGVDGRWGISPNSTLEGAVLASTTKGPGQDGAFAPAYVAKHRIRTRHWLNELDSEYISAYFRTENGFKPQSDWVSLSNSSEFHIFPQSVAVPRVFLTPVDAEAAWRTDGTPRQLEWTPGGGFWTGGGLMVMTTGTFAGEEFEEQWFTTRKISFMGGGSWTQWLRMWLRGKVGEAILYDPDDPIVGLNQSVSVDLGLQPAYFLRVAPQVAWERFMDGQTEVYSGTVSRLKVEAFATPKLWARLIQDLSTFNGRDSTELLVAWERSPGRAMYIGGHTVIERGPKDDPVQNPEREWTVFTKVSWVFDG